MSENHRDDDITHTHIPLTKDTMIGHYRIVEKIGAGGMGEVYLAEDTNLNRQVALKFLPSHLVSVDDAKKRFTREAQAAAALKHPNIVTIHEVSDYQGRPFFAMECCEGKPLRDVIREEQLSLEKIVDLVTRICEGLQEAHEAGIVHRDIKPSNIILDKQGRPKLADFGLAAVQGSDKLTKTGSTLGTIGYMSPEQIRVDEADLRSDLFSMGVVLYEMITGRLPFKGDSEAATLNSVLNDIPEPLSRFKSGVSGELQHIVSKLLEKDPQLRYQSAAGIISDLRRITVSTPSAVKSGKDWWNRYVVTGAVVVLAIIFGYWLLFDEDGKLTDDVPLIAVLPFENLGPPEDESFADGITEEITSRLAVIEGLGVISRTSAVKYKDTDKNLREIGNELGVEYILEGTIRWSKVGEQTKVRITPQLIRVSDDRHMWADNYERDLLEVFAVQADIAIQIVDQLDLTLVEKTRTALAKQPTDIPEAYAYYLRAISEIRDPDVGVRNSGALFDSVIALDPDFALAYAHKSIAHSWTTFGWSGLGSDSVDHRTQAMQAAEMALKLEPGLPMGHLAMGTYYNLVAGDYNRALEEFAKARSEMPSNSGLLWAIALVQFRQGKFHEAQTNIRMAIELDPLTSYYYYDLAQILTYTKEYDEAISVIDRAIALKPDRATYYIEKMRFSLNGRGDIDGMRNVFHEACKYVEPVEIISQRFWKYNLVNTPVDSLVADYVRIFRNTELPGLFYLTIAGAYWSAGQPGLKLAHCDSAKSVLQQQLKYAPDEYGLHMGLGYALACLGEYDQAIEEGEKAKELMSVDGCHW
ncbi:MAG: protein kinase [FCB group bacterium]|nr:protein kinase [FCB group bacterium]